MGKRKQRSGSHRSRQDVDAFNALSRRDFIRLNSALLLAAGTVGCSPTDDPPDLRTGFRILRAEDLLSLKFKLQNLQIVHTYGRPSRLVRIRGNEDALLLVGFPGQHISEQTYQALEETKDDPVSLPARSLMARPTELVFRLPANVGSVELTLEALLNWQQWEALPAIEKRLLPAAVQTHVHAPYGLTLSPDPAAFWVHATRPVTHSGRTELWHTRLASGDSANPSEVHILQPGFPADEGFEASLSAADRVDLVGKSARARTLILSPLGGWLDLRGEWQEGKIARWEHQATAGQDQRVVIQRQDGHLYPFGHPATLMTVTEREVFAARPSGRDASQPAAVLRKRDFIVIKEPQMTYSHASMVFQSVTAQVLVTPALPVADRDAPALWIETFPGEPYRFLFSARDWADGDLQFDAPAVFVSAGASEADALRLYDADDYKRHKISALSGQTAVVARFEDPENPQSDRWGEPLKKPRTSGDTTLKLVHLRFSSEAAAASSSAPFTCRTEAMEARVPALEQFLNDDLNQGWFQRVDPESDGNPAELFAKVLDKNVRRIPLHFDKQSDRCGGIAAPSFDVDGLSRVLGPVGDSTSVNGVDDIDWSKYLDPKRATLLGNFSLIRLLSETDGAKSRIVPRIDFTVEQKAVKNDSEEDDRDDPSAQENAQDPEKNGPPATYREIGVALTWAVPFTTPVDIGIIAIAPQRSASDKTSRMQLEISAGVSKAIGKPVPNAPESAGAAGSPEEVANSGDDPSTLSWSVTARIKNFELRLKAGGEPLLLVGFDYLGVATGPPGPEKKANEDDKSDSDTDDKKEKKSASSVSTKIEHKISGVDASGFLAYLQKILDAVAHMPSIPKPPGGVPKPESQTDLSFPAKLPDIGSADINVTIGPLHVPDFKWLQFDVSNIAIAVGMGFYFFARRQKGGEETRVPDNEFAIRVADIENPLTLVAEPYGGFAHLGLNFTTGRITGFQASLGVIYRFTLDLKVSEAKCEGSLAGVFTYVAEGDDGRFDVDIVLKFSGRATLWIADVYLLIVAVGKWTQDYFAFRADVYLNIKIAFFTVPLYFAFETRSGEGAGSDRMATGLQSLPDIDRLCRRDWLAYRAAFAEIN